MGAGVETLVYGLLQGDPLFSELVLSSTEWAGADTHLAHIARVTTVGLVCRDEGVRSKEMNFVLAVTSLK